jgi:hypothetical protein
MQFTNSKYLSENKKYCSKNHVGAVSSGSEGKGRLEKATAMKFARVFNTDNFEDNERLKFEVDPGKSETLITH